ASARRDGGRRHAQLPAQSVGGGKACGLGCGERIATLPAGRSVQHRRRRPPVPGTELRGALRVHRSRSAIWRFHHRQAGIQQRLQHRALPRGEGRRVRPGFRGKRAKQVALALVQHHRLREMGGVRSPFSRAANAISARQQPLQVELDLLPRLQVDDRTPTHPHGSLLPRSLASQARQYDDAKSGAEARHAWGSKMKKPLDPAVANELLDRLASDDAFRDLFSSDPPAALSSLGNEVSAEETLSCRRTNVLASKDEIASARDALRTRLTGHATGAMTVIFSFEAGAPDKRLA